MHKGAQQFPAALVSAPLQHWPVPARKRTGAGRAAREQVLASLEPAARSCWHHLSFTHAPPRERGAVMYLRSVSVIGRGLPKLGCRPWFQLNYSVEQHKGDGEGPWEFPVQHNAQWGIVKLYFYLFVSDFIFLIRTREETEVGRVKRWTVMIWLL